MEVLASQSSNEGRGMPVPDSDLDLRLSYIRCCSEAIERQDVALLLGVLALRADTPPPLAVEALCRGGEVGEAASNDPLELLFRTMLRPWVETGHELREVLAALHHIQRSPIRVQVLQFLAGSALAE
jgi:hypothetical protein